jgi:hypothetical protein
MYRKTTFSRLSGQIFFKPHNKTGWWFIFSVAPSGRNGWNIVLLIGG